MPDRVVARTLSDIRGLRSRLRTLRQRLTVTLAMETMVKDASCQLSNAATAGTEYLVSPRTVDQQASSTGAASIEVAAAVFRVKAANYAAPFPFTTKLKMICTVITNDTDPATTYTFKLRKADFTGGLLDPGTVVATLAVTPIATNAPSTFELADIDLPSDGQYVITCTPTGGPAANAGIVGKVHRYAT
jgi:hypothetical protein